MLTLSKNAEKHEDKFYYTDVFDLDGEALSIRKESMEDYLSSGGVITYHPPKTN